ncbi:MAG: adenylosuccinate synthetase, partial [Candidatus Levyibacteriota bacterium]
GADPHFKEWSEAKAKRLGIEEHGSVSGRKRKLGDFNAKMAALAYIANSGSAAAITCIDRLFPGNESVTDFKKLTREAKEFLKEMEGSVKKETKRFSSFQLISTGPDLYDMIDLRK